jgi:GNAT superfamily N-acetyltransferase
VRQPDEAVRGPEPAGVADIDAINRLFTEAFTERYHRDGMAGVRVPALSRPVWRYAIAGAGEGAMLWRDAHRELAGFSLVHQSGSEGWLGPIAIRPGLQGAGLGTRMVRSGIAWLQRRGATTIGLETMPRTMENIGFYSRLGLLPGHLTITMMRELDREAPAQPGADRLSAAVDREGTLRACRDLADRVAAGVDFTGDLVRTLDHGLGDATLLPGPHGLRAFALWHTAPLAHGRAPEDLRVLKVVAEDDDAFAEVIAAAGRHGAGAAPVERLSVRCQTAFPGAYRRLVEDGFRVHWTDLRMTLAGHEERPRPPGVLMSNWEI